MIESVTHYPSIHSRHRSAPLLRERDQYLAHLLQTGLNATRVRATATFLIRIVHLLELSSLRPVELSEIEEASIRWTKYRSPERRETGRTAEAVPNNFARIARAWLSFHNCLIDPATPAGPFDWQLAEFQYSLKSHCGLSPVTVNSYTLRARNFLEWVSQLHQELSCVSIKDVDQFFTEKRERGWQLGTVATHCQALRAFFRYAAERGWCNQRMSRGIVSPRLPKYTEAPKGPSWVQVRRLICSVDGKTPKELRARAMILLYAVYGLRSSEVARLRLDDFDWRTEIFTVRRAKRGGIQQYPIQYEVGEAILEYLKQGRARCTCRHMFLTVRLPYRPLGPGGMWGIVGRQMKAINIASEHTGPHSLRHACATHLLKKGSSLKEIAEFLGHQDTRSVGIYAKYDQRSLHKVAAFSLAGIR